MVMVKKPKIMGVKDGDRCCLKKKKMENQYREREEVFERERRKDRKGLKNGSPPCI